MKFAKRLFGDSTGLARRDFEMAGFAWLVEEQVQIAPRYACDQIPASKNGWQRENYMGWCNQTAPEATKLGDATNLAQNQRKIYYAIVQEEFARDMPSLPLFLQYPVDGTWEHIDMYMFLSSHVDLPAILRRGVSGAKSCSRCILLWWGRAWRGGHRDAPDTSGMRKARHEDAIPTTHDRDGGHGDALATGKGEDEYEDARYKNA